DPRRLSIELPLGDNTPRHISLDALQVPNRITLEEMLRLRRLPATLRYSRANRLNRVVADSREAELGIVASGKSWAALLAALDLLGLGLGDAARLGLRLMKVSMPWPLEPEGVSDFASGLKTLLVVEGKRPLIEAQIKGQLYNLPAHHRPAILGKADQSGTPLLSEVGDLDALSIATALVRLLPHGEATVAMETRLRELERCETEHGRLGTPSPRPPHFCSGCPHSRSTRVPEGSRSMAGIGCHIMTQWMGGEAAGRSPAEGYSQMGGEGVAWIGQAPFTETDHVFVNLGDGTYYHSGLLAIRAAVAAGVSITYKILYNDAVAMTGGQPVDGPLSVEQIVAQVRAEGVQTIKVVSETPERFGSGTLPDDVGLFDRGELSVVQEDLRRAGGVSVMIFDQTCAAEKRRRRKRGLAPEAQKRVMINERVCEGCGDCSRQSNCLSVEPVETMFGTKRRINQSSCNQDLSCTDGFCPSFVTIEGGSPQKRQAKPIDPILDAAAELPAPVVKGDQATANVLLPGIGGTGVTTISAVLAMAAHLDGLNVVSTDVTGLAQKGGAVLSYLRFAPVGQPLHGARMLPGSADLVIGCDLLVAAGADCLRLCSPGRTSIIAERAVAPTGRFALFQEAYERDEALSARLRRVAGSVKVLDAGDAAEALFGDRIFSNMMLVGAAYQDGGLPLSLASIEAAIDLNGVSAERNKAAFHAGRLLLEAPERLELGVNGNETPAEEDLDGLIGKLSNELIAYQNEDLANRYRSVIGKVRLADGSVQADDLRLTKALAKNLFKLMAYKDEYEVARLYSDPAFREKVRAAFGDEAKLSVQLAPPLLSRIDPATGRPRKSTFGPWIFSMFAVLARLKGLRGTRLDPFGWTAERKMERQLVEDYVRLVERILPSLSVGNYETALALLSLPESISGYGPVKEANIDKAKAEEQILLAEFESLDALAFSEIEDAWKIAAE
ncbi:MAG: indolepyruvate ferredoxin oxidoreductase family protein, partial [Geminicoccaceae bacterium]